MSEPSPRGIDRSGLDASFAADEVRKSNLILQARLQREQGDDEEASQLFAEAAAIEERLSHRCADRGLQEKSFVHRFSAAGCWAHAGNFFQAITICDELLAGDLPPSLHRSVANYVETLRGRRAQLNAQLASATASD